MQKNTDIVFLIPYAAYYLFFDNAILGLKALKLQTRKPNNMYIVVAAAQYHQGKISELEVIAGDMDATLVINAGEYSECDMIKYLLRDYNLSEWICFCHAPIVSLPNRLENFYKEESQDIYISKTDTTYHTDISISGGQINYVSIHQDAESIVNLGRIIARKNYIEAIVNAAPNNCDRYQLAYLLSKSGQVARSKEISCVVVLHRVLFGPPKRTLDFTIF